MFSITINNTNFNLIIRILVLIIETDEHFSYFLGWMKRYFMNNSNSFSKVSGILLWVVFKRFYKCCLICSTQLLIQE